MNVQIWTAIQQTLALYGNVLWLNIITISLSMSQVKKNKILQPANTEINDCFSQILTNKGLSSADNLLCKVQFVNNECTDQ